MRYCGTHKCVGWVEDYYQNGRLKHKGYYIDGQLSYVYKNYYESGELERSFKAKNEKRSILSAYYRNGKMKSLVQYFKGQPVKWEDYYPVGKTEMSEEYDKNYDHYLMRSFFYKNGNIQSTIVLTDKNKLTYNGKEYYENGQIKEEGALIFNPIVKDYQKFDDWKVYSEKGKLLEEQNFVNGILYKQKTF